MKLAGISPALPHGDSYALGDNCNPWPPAEADLKVAVKYQKRVKAPQYASVDKAKTAGPNTAAPITVDRDPRSGSSGGSSSSLSCLPGASIGMSGARSGPLPAHLVAGAPHSWRPTHLVGHGNM